MYKIKAHRLNGKAVVEQSPVKRSWMDLTHNQHAYNCFPVTLTNSLGWTVSFPEDIEFIWNGISDTNPNNVKILKGSRYAYNGRSNATISFKVGIGFKTEEDVSLLVMPVPNLFNEDYQTFTTIMSTSFFNGELPVVARIMSANKVVTIKAGTPVATIIPISLSKINNSEIIFEDAESFQISKCEPEYAEQVREKIISQGKWTNFYRNAVDACGNILGKHEVKSLRLKVIENNENN